MTAWRLLDDCLTTAWRLPDDCLTTAWWLPDDCLTTAWLPYNNVLLTMACWWQTTSWQQQPDNYGLTTTAWWQQPENDGLTTNGLKTMAWQRQPENDGLTMTAWQWRPDIMKWYSNKLLKKRGTWQQTTLSTVQPVDTQVIKFGILSAIWAKVVVA